MAGLYEFNYIKNHLTFSSCEKNGKQFEDI